MIFFQGFESDLSFVYDIAEPSEYRIGYHHLVLQRPDRLHILGVHGLQLVDSSLGLLARLAHEMGPDWSADEIFYLTPKSGPANKRVFGVKQWEESRLPVVNTDAPDVPLPANRTPRRLAVPDR